MPCRMLSSVPGLYQLDASETAPLPLKHLQTSPTVEEGARSPLIGNHWSRYVYISKFFWC